MRQRHLRAAHTPTVASWARRLQRAGQVHRLHRPHVAPTCRLQVLRLQRRRGICLRRIGLQLAFGVRTGTCAMAVPKMPASEIQWVGPTQLSSPACLPRMHNLQECCLPVLHLVVLSVARLVYHAILQSASLPRPMAPATRRRHPRRRRPNRWLPQLLRRRRRLAQRVRPRVLRGLLASCPPLPAQRLVAHHRPPFLLCYLCLHQHQLLWCQPRRRRSSSRRRRQATTIVRACPSRHPQLYHRLLPLHLICLLVGWR